MKHKHFKHILILTLATLIAGAGLLSSCTEDESQPIITGIRVTTKDSTITAGQFNLVVAIVGSGLESVTKVLFNDVSAELNPAFVSGSAIVVTIPDDVPTEITNKVTVITSGGNRTSFDFETLLPEPLVTGLYNEFAPAGQENKVLGNYFYFIEKVMIGDISVRITKVTATAITFEMPNQSVAKLPVTVVGAGGTTTSTFKIQDEFNLVNFDIAATTWGSDVCWGGMPRIDPPNSALPVISGRYAMMDARDLPKSDFNSDWLFSTCGFNFGLPAEGEADKVLKFEVNIPDPWKGGYFSIYINETYVYNYKPWDTDAYKVTGFSTDGWTTVSIPLSEFSGTINNLSTINNFKVQFSTPDTDVSRLHVAMDNFRIVDK